MFVLAVALAPLTHFLPSKRQRAVAGLREYAAVHGLFVEFRDLPGSKEAGRPMGRKAEQVIYYGLRLSASLKHDQARRAWVRNGLESSVHEQGEAPVWRGIGHREAVSDCLNELPEAVSAIGLDSSSCGIYWQEHGSQEDVEVIRLALVEWAATLS